MPSESYFDNNLLDYFVTKENILKPATQEHYKRRALEIKDLCVSAFLKDEQASDDLRVGLAGLLYTIWYMAKKDAFSEEREHLLEEAKKLLDIRLKVPEKWTTLSDKFDFMTGLLGLYFVGVLIYVAIEDEDTASKLLDKFCEGIQFFEKPNCPQQLFHGRAGYLCGLSNLRLALDDSPDLPEKMDNRKLIYLLRLMMASGRRYVERSHSPVALMYKYCDVEYLGTAYGLSGILQIFLIFPDFLKEDEEMRSYVGNCIDWYLTIQKLNGNTVPTTDEYNAYTNHNEVDDELVNWSDGATGICNMFALAYCSSKNQKYLLGAKKYS